MDSVTICKDINYINNHYVDVKIINPIPGGREKTSCDIKSHRKVVLTYQILKKYVILAFYLMINLF
jgi:hypothetical protein